MLCGVGGIARKKKHCIVILACNIVGSYQRIRAAGGRTVGCEGGDKHGRHGVVGAGLIEIIYYTKILKAAHD